MDKRDRYILTLIILHGPMSTYDAGQEDGRLGRLDRLVQEGLCSYDGSAFDITPRGRERYSNAATER